MTVDVDAVKAANPTPVIVEQLTNQAIERHKVCCPFHQEDSPSLHIYDDGSWHCFGCGAHGRDVIDFVGRYYHGASYDPAIHFVDVVDRLGALHIQPLPRHTTKPKPQVERQLVISLESIVEWHETMPDTRRAYWHGRGLTDATINSHLLGWDGKRYTIPALYRFVPFGVKRRIASDIDDGNAAKYVSITGSRSGIFNADILWEADWAIICEGEIDCMLLNQFGYRAVSPTMGANSWKPEWAKFFSHISKIHILYDNDKAGQAGARQIQASLRRAKIVMLPDPLNDIGDLVEHHNAPEQWLQKMLGAI
jgi:DNA primase